MSKREATDSGGESRPMFISFDFLYVPCTDPERDVAYYTSVLGGTPMFRVKAMGTEVAGVRLSQERPLLLLAKRLEGTLPVFVYRVENMKKILRELRRRGWEAEDEFEIHMVLAPPSRRRAANVWRPMSSHAGRRMITSSGAWWNDDNRR